MNRFALLLSALLSGCAAIGGAGYIYERTPDGGCRIEVNSGRDLSGVMATIGSDCSVEVSADKAAANVELLRVTRKLIEKLPVLPVGGM